MIIEPLYNLLDTLVHNQFRLGASAEDVLETITWWYATACNGLHTMLPSKDGEQYAEATQSEIRSHHTDLGSGGQHPDNAGRQADAPVDELQ